MSEERLKIAVFIDFDNIEIGVKSSLGGHFDVGAVLEAVKERGEVVTKVAYGDWTRATDYGRSMSQHAIHMVQRNLTPGGDKNGADINLALDALEMAFTHSHINAFVIVGGDSDFITLVETLKQYDRKVFVVGGRSFTSQVMQKNCTEFVAYEDILGVTVRGRQAGGRTRAVTDIALAMPIIRRAIKLLADREVTPQLGLLKSTLLQLDSSFSERAYGASSFYDFVEKLAKAGYVTLKSADRSFLVELREPGQTAGAAPALPTPLTPVSQEHAEPRAHREPRERREHREPGDGREGHAREARLLHPSDGLTDDHVDAAAEPPMPAPRDDEAALAQGVPRLGPVDGYRLILQAFSRSGANPRFPMYVRQFKQFMKTFDESFDERRYGFAGIIDALRYGQREGLLRLDRGRQGGVRVHPGPQYLTLTKSSEAVPAADLPSSGESQQPVLVPQDVAAVPVQDTHLDADQPPTTPEPLPFEAATIPSAQEAEAASPAPSSEVTSTEGAGSPAEPATAPPATGRKRTGARTGTRAKKAAPPTGGVKKKAVRPRAKKS
ncbi:MAG TPA: NYN domain-containing protein [Candidatus Methylomirabilis sp.]|nr:NYN domain-containing protein [Candidatus Methylomirabilis sp.]